MASKNSFPGIQKKGNPSPAEESIEILTGQRGNGDNRALLLKDLVNIDELTRAQLIKSSQSNTNAGGLPINIVGGVESPHAPVNFVGVGGFTFIALTWDHPTYNGHAYTEVYRSETEVFADAIMIATEVTDIFSDSVNMGSKYYYWIRFVNKVSVKGPLNGANGVYVETMQSAETILAELGGKIENSHLGEFLSGEIGKIPTLEFDISESRLAANEVLSSNDSLAADLIESALNNDLNWESVTLSVANLAVAVGNNQATVVSDYYTKTNADAAMALKIEALKSLIVDPEGDSIGAALYNNYYTIVKANEAIATANTTLKTAIEDVNGNSIGANLTNNYYTKTTANEAISSASTKLQALIEDAEGNSIGAALETLTKTVATNDEQWAMWAVHTEVNDLSASFGLINDGDEPIFAIKGAKFAVITSQDPDNFTPIFGTVGDKTVIKSALIDEAHIQSLVTDDLLSNRVVVGAELTTPSINYDPDTGARSQNFSISPNGIMSAKLAILESVIIKDASGNVVMSSTGAISSDNVSGLGNLATMDGLSISQISGAGALASKDDIDSSSISGLGAFAGLDKILGANITTYIESGAIGSAQINEAYIATLFGANATFSGEVFCQKITGDLVDADVVSVSASSVNSTWTTIATVSIARSEFFDVWLTIDNLIPEFNTTGIGVFYTRLKYGSQEDKAVSIPAGESNVSVAIQVFGKEYVNSEIPEEITLSTQNATLQMFRKGSGFIT